MPTSRRRPPCRCGPAASRVAGRCRARPARALPGCAARRAQDDDHRSHAPAVAVIGGLAHDRHDLLHRRRVGRVAHSLFARWAAGVVAGQGRRRATPPRRVEHGQHGHGTSSHRTAETSAALQGPRSPDYRSPLQSGRQPEPRTRAARGRVLVQRRSEPRLAGDASLRAGAALLPPSAESAARMGGGLRLVAVGGDHANPVLGAISLVAGGDSSTQRRDSVYVAGRSCTVLEWRKT
jgi:hypothetical protein